MITEDYVSFETAKLLKEKGFDEGCNSYFISDNEIALISNRRDFNNNGIYLSAPTLQMAMKWLRERYKLNIIISVDDLDWFYSIIDYTHKGDVKLLRDLAGFNSYESACESAIKYCLEHLI